MKSQIITHYKQHPGGKIVELSLEGDSGDLKAGDTLTISNISEEEKGRSCIIIMEEAATMKESDYKVKLPKNLSDRFIYARDLYN